MELPEETDATLLLQRMHAGDEAAREELAGLVYGHLRGLARSQLGGAPGHTLQPTALVNEAWLKLIAAEDARYPDRRHFFAMAARVMRNVLVDHAREGTARKRGGDRVRVPLSEDTPVDGRPPREHDLLDLHEALEELEVIQPELARAIELRFFGGLGVSEVAEAMALPQRTAERRLRAASAWLRERLAG